MNLEIMAIKDEKIGSFMPPISVKHAQEALRGISQLLKDPNGKSPIQTNPADFSLWKIGVFDDVTGIITNLKEGPAHIINIVNIGDES